MGRKMTDRMYTDFAYEEYVPHICSRYNEMKEKEQLWEEVQAEDAEVLLVSYGISSRICKEAVKMARSAGLKLGLIRPMTVWPFPVKAFQKYNGKVKGYLSVEMIPIPQMIEDVYLASHGTTPVYAMPTGREIAASEDIIENVKAILNGTKEVY